MPKKKARRRKPPANLSIEQLEEIARYLGYALICVPGSVSLYDCRTIKIVKRDDRALDHLRTLYMERAPFDPELAALDGAA